jgi:enoyl-CoA hydratase/carnithine racemase
MSHKLGIAPMFIMEQILEYLPAKRALDFSQAANSAPTLQIGLVSRVVGPNDLDGTVGEFVARCARATVASCSPASALCVPLAKCRPRPVRLTRSWKTRNLPWRH